MQKALSNDLRSTARNESCRSVVANLVTLIEHLSVSRNVLELAIGRETALAWMWMRSSSSSTISRPTI
jgi:hypothetical protein